MSCQLTLFLAFLLQRWLRWLHVLARKPRKFGAQLFKGFISSQRQRIWTMSLITGYDGILDTGIHAAALLLMGQNIATSAKQRRPPYKADLLLVCQVPLERPIWRYALLGWYLRLSVVRITLSCRTRCSSGASIAALSIKGSWYSYFSKPSPRLAPSYILQPLCCSCIAGLGLYPLVTITGDSVIGGKLSRCQNEIVDGVFFKMVFFWQVEWQQTHSHTALG